MTETVIVFGATSYVGQTVISELVRSGYRVQAVVRRQSIARMLLDEARERVELISIDNIERDVDRHARAIVNLAYARDAAPFDLYRQTRQLMQLVGYAARASRADRIIHISTLAVFGYELERRPRPIEVPWRPADSYIETKIYAERLLVDASSQVDAVASIRLGNVIGPAAPIWIASVAQRILDSKPLGYATGLGYTNATYVTNVGDYICELVRRPASDLRAFGVYHHLAEFAGVSWGKILDRIAAVVGTDYLLVEPGGEGRGSAVRAAARGLLWNLYVGPTGGYARAVMERIDSHQGAWRDVVLRLADMKRVARLVAPVLEPSDAVVCGILSTPVQFESHTLPAWEPPVAFGEALDRITNWLMQAGYGPGTAVAAG